MSTKEKVLELINKELEENYEIINNESDYHYDDYQAVKIQTNFLASMQSKIEQFPDNEADLRKENKDFRKIFNKIPNNQEIEDQAENYAENENSCFVNDFSGFKKGVYWVIELLNKE